MYMWVSLTLLIGAQSWAISRGQFHQQNVFLDFPIDRKNLTDFDKTVQILLKNFLVPSSYTSIHDLKLRKDSASNNQINWNITAIGTSILNEIKILSNPFGISEQSTPYTTVSTHQPQFSNTTQSPLSSIGLTNYSTTNYKNSTRAKQINRFNLRDSVYHELFEFPWKLIPLGMKAASNLREYSKKNDYINKGYLPWQSSISKNPPKSKKLSNLKTTTLINKSKHYVIGLRPCLSSEKSHFNVRKAVVSITKHSPQIAAMIVKNRFKRPVPHHPALKTKIYNEYEAMTCHALATSKENYEKCLRELKRIGNCVAKRMKKSAEPKKLRNNYIRNLWPSAAQLIKDIGALNNSCNVDNRTLTISCFIFKHSRNNFNVRLLIGNFMESSKSTEAAQKTAEKMIKLMLKSNLGTNILDEIGTLIYIYHKGVSSQKKLSKMVRINPRVKEEYKKVSKALKVYKHNLIKLAVRTIDDVRTVTTSVERTLVKTMSQFLGIDFSEHVRSMRCLDMLMDAILGPWFGSGSGSQESKPKPPPKPVEKPSTEKPDTSEASDDQSDDDDDDEDEDDDHEDDDDDDHDDDDHDDDDHEDDDHEDDDHEDDDHEDDHHDNGDDDSNSDHGDKSDEEKKDPARKKAVGAHENAAKSLMNSLKRLSQTKMLRKQSTITNLANTFLLATMFYECITVLAAAIYRTERIPGYESTTVSPIGQIVSTSYSDMSSPSQHHDDDSYESHE